jgi:hypothetical protein
VKLRYLVVALLALVLAARVVPTNRIQIVNESGQTAHAVRVVVCNRATHLADIPPGGSVTCWYHTPKQEDYLRLDGLLSDGAALREPCLYVVWEDYFRSDRVVIRPEGIVARR